MRIMGPDFLLSEKEFQIQKGYWVGGCINVN